MAEPTGNPKPETPMKSVLKGAGAGAAFTGAGIGIGLIAQALSGQPEILAHLVDSATAWGPGLVILLGFGWMGSKVIPPFLASHQEMAQNVGKLAGSLDAMMTREDDVRMAVRALSGEFRDMREELRTHLAKSGGQ